MVTFGFYIGLMTSINEDIKSGFKEPDCNVMFVFGEKKSSFFAVRSISILSKTKFST